jgi:hypothetical protein
MDFAELRSSIFEGEEEETIPDTPVKDQLVRPMVGFPLLLGVCSMGLWGFDKYAQDGKMLSSEGEYNYSPLVFSVLGLLPLGFGLGGLMRGMDAHDEASKYEQLIETAEAEMERLDAEAAEKEAEEERAAEEKRQSNAAESQAGSVSFYLNAASSPNSNTQGIYGSTFGQQGPISMKPSFQRDVFGF